MTVFEFEFWWCLSPFDLCYKTEYVYWCGCLTLKAFIYILHTLFLIYSVRQHIEIIPEPVSLTLKWKERKWTVSVAFQSFLESVKTQSPPHL